MSKQAATKAPAAKPANLPYEEAYEGVLKYLAKHGRTLGSELRKERVPYGPYAKLARNLEEAGHIKRVKNEDDKGLYWEITKKGLQHLKSGK